MNRDKIYFGYVIVRKRLSSLEHFCDRFIMQTKKLILISIILWKDLSVNDKTKHCEEKIQYKPHCLDHKDTEKYRIPQVIIIKVRAMSLSYLPN